VPPRDAPANPLPSQLNEAVEWEIGERVGVRITINVSCDQPHRPLRDGVGRLSLTFKSFYPKRTGD
jgi:hypothetical protein